MTGGLLRDDDDVYVTRVVLTDSGEAGVPAGPSQAPAREPGGRTAAVPGVVAVVSTALTAVGLLLYLKNRMAPGTGPFFDPVLPAVALTAPAVGSVLATRRPRDPTGWLLCAGGLAAVAFLAEQYAVYALLTDPGSLPAASWMAWIGSWAWIPGLLPLTTLLLVVPTGRLPSVRWRPVAWAVLTVMALAVAAAALTPDSAGSVAPGNPAGIGLWPALGTVTVMATGAFALLLGPLCLGGLLVRYRRSTIRQRAQLRWFVAAACVAVAAPFAGLFVPLGLHQALGVAGLVGLSGGLAVGVVKHGLYDFDSRDVDLLTSRAIVYGAVVGATGAVYWIVVRLLGAGLGITPGGIPNAVAIVAAVAAVRPLVNVLGVTVDRLRSPRRAYHALTTLGHCLQSSIVPDEVLPALAGTIAATLEVPYVAVEVGNNTEVTAAAVFGEPREDVIVVPLVHHHEVVGRLTVAPKPGELLQPLDVRLLRDLAGQAGAAAYGVRLTADLRRSRERLVTAREENWRDVRRQLHDRLGPLDGILLGIGAAANTLSRDDAEGTNTLLTRLKGELRSEIADIRALVDQLRPRSLDELGLVGALQRQAALMALPPRPLAVTVEAADLGALPSAVEVAVYLIVSEALTNVRRHALARHCQIRLAVTGGWLELEVADDGLGLAREFLEGVGVACMRERAAELGGSFSVEAGAAGGTSVCVEVPLCDQ